MDSLMLCGEGQEIHLHGVGSTAPVRRARRTACAVVEGGWRETVEVYLEGLPAAMSELRTQIERLLAPRSAGRRRGSSWPPTRARRW